MNGKKQVVTMFPGSKAASIGTFDAQEFNANVEQQAEAMSDKNTEFKKPDKTHQEIIDEVILALKNVYDPEIPLNIYDLGLIYNVELDDEYVVHINMTLTSPGCPVAQTFPIMVEQRVSEVEGVYDAEVSLVWDPPWTKDQMSEEALLTLGLI